MKNNHNNKGQAVQRVLRLFSELPNGQSLTSRELSQQLGRPWLRGRRLAGVLRGLVGSGRLLKLRGRGYAERPATTVVEGTIKRKPHGNGQLWSSDNSYFVNNAQLRQMVDGDRVRARLDMDDRGRLCACDLELLQRRNRLLVGTLDRVGGTAIVEAEDGSFGDPIFISESAGASRGDLVEVRLDPEVVAGGALRGSVQRVLGKSGSSAAEAVRILVNHGIEQQHPAEVIAAAEAMDGEIGEAERRCRVDLSERPLVTIDGADAADFDDAVAVEQLGDLRRLTVAIADVSHYVLPGSPVDNEAKNRGTSVYWPGGVSHMLPARLAADLCSLRPNEPRRCMVAEMLFDAAGVMQEASLYQGIVRSFARLTYPQVNAAFTGPGEARQSLKEHWPHLQMMVELAQQLENAAKKAGRLDLDIPEPVFVLNEQGDPVDGFARPMAEAERLVEAFMVVANTVVARWLKQRERPALYRVHPAPNAEQLQPFVDASQAITQQRLPDAPLGLHLSSVLRTAQSSSDRRLLSYLLLRCLPQAKYETKPLGHYGLAAPDYLHFTSPIRRYPDLVVHRALKADLAEERVSQVELDRVEGYAVPVNQRERNAMQVERMIDAMLASQLAADCVGQTFTGHIQGIVPSGLYVGIERPLFEGFLPIRLLLPEDYYVTSEQGLSVTGRRRRQRYRLGDSIRVCVDSVDIKRRSVDLLHVID